MLADLTPRSVALLLTLAALTLGSCGHNSADDELGTRSAALGTPTALYTATPNANLSWTGATPNLFEIESSSAIIPPGVDTTNCPNGRMFMNHGRSDAVAGVSRLVDSLPLLSNPQAYVVGPISNGAAPGSGTIVDEYPTLPSDTVPSGVKACFGTTCSCVWGNTVPKYLRGATDAYTVRAGTSTVLQMVAAMSYKQGNVASNCQAVPDKAVNIIRRSTNCGVNWTTSVLNANGYEGKFFSNADLPFMYVDRNNTNRVFVVGGSGPALGGVSGQVVWKSSDNGQTWTPKFSPKTSGGSTVFLSAFAMTSTSAGTIVLAGCGPSSGNSNDAALYVYYSVDGGEFWSGPITQPSFVSNCGSIFGSADSFNANYMPGHLKRKPHGGAGPYVSLSRVKPSVSANYTTVRMAYTMRENDSGGVSTSQRQVMRIIGIEVPKPGGVIASDMYNVGTVRPAGPDDSIFIGTYIETDAFGPATETDAALFWWLEGRRSDDSYTGRYLLHTGPRTLSSTYQLTTNADGTPFRWNYNVYCKNDTTGGGPPDANGYTNIGHWMCWMGEYERGAFWYESAANKLHFAPQWTSSNPGTSGLHNFYRFNEIAVTP